MRVLVTGGSGFIGRHVLRQASAAGWEVITAGRRHVPGSTWHLKLDLSGDHVLRITGELARLQPDVVVNCAGATSGSTDELAAANLTLPSTLVRALLLGRIPARLVHLGSAAEYGQGPPDLPVHEEIPARPVSVYGATKLAATQMIEIARAAGLDAVVLRVFNPVGSGAPASSLPGRVATALRAANGSGGTLRLGPLDAVRDFVDVRDVAAAVIAAATVPATPHTVFNIARGQGVAARELVAELLTVSGSRCAVEETEPESNRSAGVSWQQAVITRAHRELGWRPRHDLAASVADLWEATA